MSAAPERVILEYTAPVYVTVNLATGDVERVYMDDENVERPDGPLLTGDEEPIDDTRFDPEVVDKVTERALEIAETVDWTSTEGRCQVWRGAEGGPRHMLSIVRSALMAHLDPEHDQIVTMRAAPGSDVEFVHQDDFKAALRYLDDLVAWDAEHRLDAPSTTA